ncbi:MAG: ATPase, partial [Firmicutes bacterium]|nr:ATPase [Bacillota bacterium]
WEDLSELLIAYEKLGLKADREVVGQYIQLPRIAKDFANYLELYYKYRRTYHVEDILLGQYQQITVSELRAAPFDEALSVIGLLLSRLSEASRNVRMEDALTTGLHVALKSFKRAVTEEDSAPGQALDRLIEGRQSALKTAKDAGQLDKETRDLTLQEIAALQSYRSRLVDEDIADEEAFSTVKGWFGDQVETRRQAAEQCSAMFDHAFAFLEETFDQSQELVMLVTEITAGYDTSWFVENFGCDAYFRHNRDLLFDETQSRIREKIAKAREDEK